MIEQSKTYPEPFGSLGINSVEGSKIQNLKSDGDSAQRAGAS